MNGIVILTVCSLAPPINEAAAHRRIYTKDLRLHRMILLTDKIQS